eukprot:10546371-Alexandrium_andersonii.AAC.1
MPAAISSARTSDDPTVPAHATRQALPTEALAFAAPEGERVTRAHLRKRPCPPSTTKAERGGEARVEKGKR